MKSISNWNAVCLAGVVGSALTLIEDPAERAAFVAGAEVGRKFYLRGFGVEGYCSEGIGYWGYGFGHFMVLSEIVRINTQNSIDWLKDRVSAQIALFPLRVEILNKIYPSFSDIRGIYSKPDEWMIDFAEERMCIAKKNAISFWSTAMLDEIGEGELYFYGMVQLHDFPDYDIDPAQINQENHSEIRDFFNDGGLLISRSFKRDPQGMAVAIKGGNNAESHNHNDLGTFEVVLGSDKFIIDPGAQLYGRQSGENAGRYESEMMNSFGHPVPVVAGQLQLTGKSARAVIFEKDFSLLRDFIKFDLTSAYKVSTLKNLTRLFTFKRAKTSELIVIDEVEYSQPEKFETAIIVDTYDRSIMDRLSCQWKLTGENKWVIQKGDDAIQIAVFSPGNEIILKEKPVEAHKGRMPEGYHPVRLGFEIKDKVKSARIEIKIVPVIK